MGPDPVLTLVLGGARAGKSRLAERIATGHPPPWIYIATAEARDAEMQERIDNHRKRRGPDWQLVEEPVELAGAIKAAQQPGKAVLVDCLTLWLSNLLERELPIERYSDELLAVLAKVSAPVIIVSNEAGNGIVPVNSLARRFRDESGILNQRIANIADEVLLVVAGQTLTLKSAVAAGNADEGGCDGTP